MFSDRKKELGKLKESAFLTFGAVPIGKEAVQLTLTMKFGGREKHWSAPVLLDRTLSFPRRASRFMKLDSSPDDKLLKLTFHDLRAQADVVLELHLAGPDDLPENAPASPPPQHEAKGEAAASA